MNSVSTQRDTILFVDDSPTIRRFAEEYISSCIPDYRVETSENALKAIERLKTEFAQRVALIISDINMPGMSGIDFAKTIKAEPSMPNIPFILCSGNSGNYQTIGTPEYEEMRELLRNGQVDGILKKPFKMSVMKDIVGSAIVRPEIIAPSAIQEAQQE